LQKKNKKNIKKKRITETRVEQSIQERVGEQKPLRGAARESF